MAYYLDGYLPHADWLKNKADLALSLPPGTDVEDWLITNGHGDLPVFTNSESATVSKGFGDPGSTQQQDAHGQFTTGTGKSPPVHDANIIYRAQDYAARHSMDGNGQEFATEAAATKYANDIMHKYGDPACKDQNIVVSVRPLANIAGAGTTGVTWPPSLANPLMDAPALPAWSIQVEPGNMDQQLIDHETAHVISAMQNMGGSLPSVIPGAYGPKYSASILDSMGHGASFLSAYQPVLAGELPDFAIAFNQHVAGSDGLLTKSAGRRATITAPDGSKFVCGAGAVQKGFGDPGSTQSRQSNGTFGPGDGSSYPEIHARDLTAGDGSANSPLVTHAQFQAAAGRGEDTVMSAQANASPPINLMTGPNIDAVNTAANSSWGGVTIDSHTGEIVHATDGTDPVSVTMRSSGQQSVVLTTAQASDPGAVMAAMQQAQTQFATQLASQGAALGVFHDDDAHTVQFDPVLVVQGVETARDVGAYTHATGGAYRFSDGNGYWAPHVS